MKEYIEREEAMNACMKDVGPIRYHDINLACVRAAIRISEIPAADVVEVVRCADCKYDERCMFQDFVQDERVEPYDKTVFFCADGKRKGGQDDG